MVWIALYVIAALASVGSIVAGRPWVAIPARKTAPGWVQDDPAFHWMSTMLTWLWAGLFALAAAINATIDIAGTGLVVGALLTIAGWRSPALGSQLVKYRMQQRERSTT